MKKILLLLVCAAGLFLTAACHQNEAGFDDGSIYFFYQTTCPHCHEALDYINRKYPDLKMTMVNVADDDGYNMFVACAKKFNLGSRIGTPLFCMGNKHIMGWSPEFESKFDEYVKPYL